MGTSVVLHNLVATFKFNEVPPPQLESVSLIAICHPNPLLIVGLIDLVRYEVPEVKRQIPSSAVAKPLATKPIGFDVTWTVLRSGQEYAPVLVVLGCVVSQLIPPVLVVLRFALKSRQFLDALLTDFIII